MKSFKPWDCIIQVVLIVGAVFYGLFFRGFGDLFLASYFVVGTWQMISVVAHAASPASYRIAGRKVYLWLLLITVVATLVVLLTSLNSSSDFILGWLFGILFWTPVLAVFYLIVCVLEIQKMRKAALPAADEAPAANNETI